MNKEDHLATARRLIAIGGSDVDTMTWPTERDVDTAKVHALICIAESLETLVAREDLTRLER